MYLTAELYNETLELLKVKIQLAGVPVVFVKPFYFASKEDFAARADTTYQDDLEAEFVMFRLKSYQDGQRQPMCDNPTVNLNFRLTYFREYVAARKDDESSYSRQDFVENIISLRESFFFNQVLKKTDNDIDVIVEHKELVPLGDILENEETRFLKDVKGDSIEFSLLVEVA